MKKTLGTFTLAAILLVSICSEKCMAVTKEDGAKNQSVQYACMPCGSECDESVFTEPGSCSHCNMLLVEKSTIKHKNIEPDEMCSINEEKTIFLDVRTPAEFNGSAKDKFGAIKNAINIPVQELEKRIGELKKYKDKEIIVYCSHSHRSPRASYMLTQKGFTQVTNMSGGMSTWKERVKDNACNEKLYKPQ